MIIDMIEGAIKWEGSFGGRLRAARLYKKLTQASLARKTLMAVTVISDFECNQRLPSLTNFYRLVKALNISADYFFKDNNEGTNDKP